MTPNNKFESTRVTAKAIVSLQKRQLFAYLDNLGSYLDNPPLS